MVATQTITVQTVSRFRCLKIFSLVFLAGSVIVAIVSICSTWWIKSGSFHTGLFQECTRENEPSHTTPLPQAPMPGNCHAPARDSGFIKAVAGLMISGIILTFLAFVFNGCGLSLSDLRRKHLSFRLATVFGLLSVFLELIALIVFPAVFYSKMKDFGTRRDWEMDWSYGLAWVSMLLTLAAVLSLICDKSHEEVHYKEKTIYRPPPELA